MKCMTYTYCVCMYYKAQDVLRRTGEAEIGANKTEISGSKAFRINSRVGKEVWQ